MRMHQKLPVAGVLPVFASARWFPVAGVLPALAIALLSGCLFMAAGCTNVGDFEVHVESGNQTSGFLTRPLSLTASSDASVQNVAQRICSNVRPGSLAQVVFVGKVPGPGPVDLTDWGKYRYDCQAVAAPAVARPASVPATVPVAATAVPAPAAAALPPAPPSVAFPAPAAQPAMPPPAPLPAAAVPLAVPLTDAQEQHRRECQRKQGTYAVCVGSCLASSSSSSGVVEAECTQRCAPQAPTGCN